MIAQAMETDVDHALHKGLPATFFNTSRGVNATQQAFIKKVYPEVQMEAITLLTELYKVAKEAQLRTGK